MNRILLSALLFLLYSVDAFAAAYPDKTCNEVYSYCAFNGKRDVGGTMMSLSEIDPSKGDCWETQKVYRCVDNDWTNSCSASWLTSNGFTLAPNGDNFIVEKFYTNYSGNSYKPTKVSTNIDIRQVDVYAKTYSNPYILDCPSSTFLDGMTPSASIASFTNAARGADCLDNTPWHPTSQSTTVTQNYGGKAFSFNFGNPIKQESHWTCTTSVSSSCTNNDIKNCKSLGVVGNGINPNLPPVDPLGKHSSGTEYFECELNKSTTCDSKIESCEDPFETITINHPVFSAEPIGKQVKYMCYNGSSQECDRTQGYASCQWSYYDCEVLDTSIVASENWHKDSKGVSRNYGQCKKWVDNYVCPSEVVVSCNDEKNSCGPEKVTREEYDAGGKRVYWETATICYNGDINQTCNDPTGKNFHSCVKVGATCTKYDNVNHTNPDGTYGTCVKWVDDYACPSDSTYTCDRQYEDCKPPVLRPGTSQSTGTYKDPNQIYFGSTVIGSVYDNYCWTGKVNETCAIEDKIDKTQCTWTGFSCTKSDPLKGTPNIVNGRDYGTCVQFVDNYVCDNDIKTTCDNATATNCGPVDYLDGKPGAVAPCAADVRAREVLYQKCLYDGGTDAACTAANPAVSCTDTEGNQVVTNPDKVWIDWTEQYSCYTGDYIEKCEDVKNIADVKQCQKTGFTCLVDDPVNKSPDPYYGTCVNYIDRYVCGHDKYEECDSKFEMCQNKTVEDTVKNKDGFEVRKREVEYCYTGDINQSQCVLDEDKCYLYDTNADCQYKIAQRDLAYQQCVDAGGSDASCASSNPQPSCRVEVECPMGDRFGVDCQLDWTAHDVALDACLKTGTKSVGDCEAEAPLPKCTPENIPYIDCPHSGFTCTQWDYSLTAQQAADNEFEGREYGYCVKWADRYTCPQFQTQDCSADIDKTECGPLGYVEISNAQDGQATDYTTVLECVAGNAPDCVVDPSCTLKDVGCSEYKDGLCIAKKQVWSCATSRDDCVKWESSCVSPNNVGFGQDNDSPNNIGEMLAQASVAKMVSENTTITAGEIRIFEGKPKTCRKMEKSNVQAMIVAALALLYWTYDPSLMQMVVYGGFLLSLDYDCCKVDNSAAVSGSGMGADTCQNSGSGDCNAGYDQGFLDLLICNEEETELAKSRGSKLVVGDFGKYCSEDLLGFCLQRSYGFCEFDNLFSRIVQEQGREQIANALTQGAAGSQEAVVPFSYYTNIAGGAWKLTEVNGNKVAFWLWDEACKDYSLNLNPPNNVDPVLPPICPYSDEVHIASCEGNNCNYLPDSPYTNEKTLAGGTVKYTDYKLSVADPFVKESFAVNRVMYVTGQCGSKVVDLSVKVLNWAKTSFDVVDTITLTALPSVMSGGNVIDKFAKVQINWGDGTTGDMVLNAGGTAYEISKKYLGPSGSSGYSITATFSGTSGKRYATKVNLLVEAGAPVNLNSNVNAGVIYLSGRGGAMNAESCEYKVSAYPAAGGSSTKIGYDVNWVTNGYEPRWSSFEYDIGGFKLVPFEYKGGTSSLTNVRVKIDDVEYDVPKDTAGSEVDVGDLTFIGSCSDMFFSCNYRVYKTILIELLPWGSSKVPNCRGFTVDEVEVLDFGAMDLSEWIATLLPKPPKEEELLSDAADSAQTFEDAMKNGGRVSGGVVKAVYYDEVTAHPREEFTFQTIGGIAINADVKETFNRVVINWGDSGAAHEDMAYLSGKGFRATHKYGRTSGTNGFNVQFAFYADSGRVYTTSVKILIGYGSNTNKVTSSLGGGDITLEDFAIKSNSVSGLHSATGG